jgi:hypothetical protein
MLPDRFYKLARHKARIHVQARLDQVDAVAHTPSWVPVMATVHRVFRGADLLTPDTQICFDLPVTRPGDDIPFGGLIWVPDSKLRDTDYIEVFLNGTPPKYDVALSQYLLLKEPTNSPRMRGSYPMLARRERIDKWFVFRPRVRRIIWRCLRLKFRRGGRSGGDKHLK